MRLPRKSMLPLTLVVFACVALASAEFELSKVSRDAQEQGGKWRYGNRRVLDAHFILSRAEDIKAVEITEDNGSNFKKLIEILEADGGSAETTLASELQAKYEEWNKAQFKKKRALFGHTGPSKPAKSSKVVNEHDEQKYNKLISIRNHLTEAFVPKFKKANRIKIRAVVAEKSGNIRTLNVPRTWFLRTKTNIDTNRQVSCDTSRNGESKTSIGTNRQLSCDTIRNGEKKEITGKKRIEHKTCRENG